MSRKDNLEGELSEKASLLAIWRGFMEHPGYALLEKALLEQRNARVLTFLDSPMKGVGEAFAQEFMKGEASGLGLASKFAQVQAELLELDVKRLQTAVELEEAHEDQIAERTGGAGGRVDNERDWFGGSGGG